MIRLLSVIFFIAGLVVPGWVGAGYVGSSNYLALAMTLLIGVVYVGGALELYRYHRETSALAGELSSLSGTVDNLDSWLVRLPKGLRNAVRLRVSGERVGLPAPSMAPYLVGLLVLLGMLGTFLGMVATLRGTGLALESATDLAAIRASLAAPVQGLGLAFGTSVAGVATSAMLGLLAAMCRRERTQAAQLLDAQIPTYLHGHTQARQREQSLALLQSQAQLMPQVAEQLQTVAAALQARSETLSQAVETRGETLARALEQRTETLALALEHRTEALAMTLEQRIEALATTLDQRNQSALAAQDERSKALAEVLEQRGQTLAEHLEQSSQSLASTLEQSSQSVAATLEQRSQSLAEAIAQRSQDLASTLIQNSQTVTATLERVSQDLAAAMDERHQSMGDVVQHSTQTLADSLMQRSQSLSDQLAASQEAFHAKAESAYASLAASVEQSLASGMAEGARAAGTAIEPIAQSTMQALAAETAAMREMVEQALNTQMLAVTQHSQEGAAAMTNAWNQALQTHQHDYAARMQEIGTRLDGFVQALEARSAAVVEGVATRLDGAAATMARAWEDAIQRQAQTAKQLADDNQAALAQTITTLEQQAAEWVQQAGASQHALREQLAEQDAQRLNAWADTLSQAAQALRQAWQQTGEEVAGNHQRISKALEEAAAAITTETREQARDTIAQMRELAQDVALAPKAAAEAVAEVRQKLSDSMARDNVMLEERGRLLETLSTLLDAVNHASTEQRKAVDDLVGTSADVLQRVGTQFTDKVQAETDRLTGVAEQVTSGATHVAGLSEAFGAAVQAFGESNQALLAQLQRIEEAMDKSMTRSDEQLAYYVAQAREVVDLSMLSQKQIIEELRQMGGSQAQTGAQAS